MKKFLKNKILFYMIFILSPAALLLLLSYVHKCNAFIGKPVWSDEVSYWREVFSFANCGTKTGYYGIGEILPKIGQFSTHGFFPSFFYFPFAKILGWHNNSIVLANLFFTIICFTLLIFFIKPSVKQSIGLILLYLLYPPILLYASTSMTEIINYGLLSLFFVFFYLYTTIAPPHPQHYIKNLFLTLMILVGTICSFYRITYVVLFILPIILLYELRSYKFMLLTILGIFYSGCLYLVNSLFVAPFSDGVLYKVLNSGSLKTSIHLILINIQSNIVRLIDIKNGEHTEVFFRIFYIIAIILYFSLMFFRTTIVKNKKDFLSLSFRDKIEKFYLMQFILLLLPLCLIIVAYDIFDFRDYRTLSPFLWASFLNLILFRRNITFTAILPFFILFFGASLFFLPAGILYYNGVPMNEIRYTQKEEQDFPLINEFVKYNESATDPFENTMVTNNIDFELWSKLHPGIGIEFGVPQENLKSKYILINTNLEIHGYTFKRITEFGYLYIKN